VWCEGEGDVQGGEGEDAHCSRGGEVVAVIS